LLNAYSGFFFYATGITPAMNTGIVGESSQYMVAFVDSKGDSAQSSVPGVIVQHPRSARHFNWGAATLTEAS